MTTYVSSAKKQLRKKKIVATTTFTPEVAKKLVDISYYMAQAKNTSQLEFLEREKSKLKTPRLDRITNLLEKYKVLGETEACPAGKVLLGIYNKNKEAAEARKSAINTNLVSVISKPEVLLLAYKAIKGNKGALTQGAPMSPEAFAKLDEQQKKIYFKSLSLPDGISLHDIHLISRLIRTGRYPWGSSSRIYMDKPGQPGKLRPITIPPFSDKLVQKAIEMTLISIYEPYFERRNRSFGFRPNKGCHDALVAILKNKETNGMRTAVEGDIEAAYDSVDRDILIKILGKKISDQKFLQLVRERLNYDFVEKESNLRIKPTLGIPQGGIDSPYMFNIYMHELDEFVSTKVSEKLFNLSEGVEDGSGKRKFSKVFTSNRAKKKKSLRSQAAIKKELRSAPADRSYHKVIKLRRSLFSEVKALRLVEHHKNRISSTDNTKRFLRFFYVRYADDWIFLTNGSKEIGSIVKTMIADFLSKELKLTLSSSKTLITNITKEPAKFLGYELKISGRGPLRKKKSKIDGDKKKSITHKISGLLMYAAPDRQRMINKFHMKGFCSKDGFPTTLPWLSCLEAHAIIERFNASIRGLAEYYLPIIRNRASIHRWIYILRFACLKTLAQKYKCTIGKIFKRFGHNTYSKSAQTVKVRVVQKIDGKEHYKDWVLLTYKDLTDKIKQYSDRSDNLQREFEAVEKGQIGGYPLKKGRLPKVTNDDYLKQISWVSWRTAAAINMPCSYCGTDEGVQQHHIKHVRKRAYSLIPEQESYQKIMALRNRKQIPLCETCHKKLVHTGKYDGPKLINLAPRTTMLDNRIIHVESFVKPGEEYFGKTILEKGWKPLGNKEVQQQSYF